MTRTVTGEWVRSRRLATTRLSGGPLATSGDAVRLLTCVQSQDAPLACWSLGQRTRNETYAAVLADQRAGGFVRTHALRPTWHFVAPEDLRWILRCTSPKVESSMAARHRGLGLDGSAGTRNVDAVLRLLRDPSRADLSENALTRKEIQAELRRRELLASGEQVGHTLLLAELRGLICSGPPRGTEHTYLLVDETIPPNANDDLDRESAVRLLTRRFFAGHGPADERDLSRWCGLTLTEIRAAVADLADDLTEVDLNGQRLWYDPSTPSRSTRAQSAYLLPTFDEVALTYPRTGFPSEAPTLDRSRLVAESGGGIVVLGGADVGLWKRSVAGAAVTVTVRLDNALRAAERDAIEVQAQRLATFLDRSLTLSWA